MFKPKGMAWGKDNVWDELLGLSVNKSIAIKDKNA